MALTTEEILQAMQIIADKSIEGLKLDRTYLCTITDNSCAEEGKYAVTDGSVEFFAYSENTRYTVGMNVYVTVPQNSFDNDCLIIGKYTNGDDEKPYTYVSPADSYVNIYNFNTSNLGKFGITANGDTPKRELYHWEASNESEYLVGYDRLYISGDFSTAFGDLNVTNGNYGLILELTTNNLAEYYVEEKLQDRTNANIQDKYDVDLVTDELNSNKFKDYSQFAGVLDTQDMFGNPYKFIIPIEQEKTIDISSFGVISAATLYLYQMSNFEDENGAAIAAAPLDNIFVENIEIGLGYDISRFADGGALLYTLDGLEYNANNTANKTIHLRWLYKTEDDIVKNIASITDSNLDNNYTYEIHWYKFVEQNNIRDELAGDFWQEIVDNKNAFSYSLTPDAANHQYEMVKVIIVATPINEDGNLSQFIINSNEVQFRNTDQVLNYTTLDLVKGLKIYADDVYNGVYLLYNKDDGKINTNIRSTTNFQLTARYSSIKSGIRGFDGNENVYWLFPKGTNTMISISESENNYTVETSGDILDLFDHYVKENNWQSKYTCLRKISNNAVVSEIDIGGREEKSFALKYKINEMYFPSRSNNKVYCIVEKNGYYYVDDFEMLFGTQGINGTEYSLDFRVYTDDNKPYALNYNNANSIITVQAQLYDVNGEELSSLSVDNYEFSWYNCNESNGLRLQNQRALNNKCLIDIKVNGTTTLKKHLGNILQVKVRTSFNSNSMTFTDYLPISLCNSDEKNKSQFEGCSRIIYNMDNTITSDMYYKGSTKLWDQNYTTEYSSGSWSIKVYYYGRANATDIIQDNVLLNSNELSNYPSLDSKNRVQAKSLYLNELYGIPVLLYIESNNVIWAQPIYVGKNYYGSPLLNAWDGSLTIDESNNAILSSMMGAGRKDNENKFTGVFMGEVGKAGLTANSSTVGIFGYHAGEQNFSVKVDGTATLGKSGKGQIIFDGNTGTIQSGNYHKDSEGTKIELTNGIIDSWNFQLKSKNVYINSTEESTEYLNIKDNDGNQLFVAGTSGYYLQTANRKNKIDLLNGTITIQTNNYASNSKGSKFVFGETSSLEVNENFKLKAGDALFLSSYGTTSNPYLRIRNDQNKTLILIDGTNYYLQSADYVASSNGFKLDIKNNTIDAPHLKLTSDNILLDSTGGSTYFRIKNGSNILFNAGNGSYYLQTNAYSSTIGSKIDLYNGTIDLKSLNYNSTNKTGTRLNLNSNESSIEIYDKFDLRLGTNKIIMSSSGNPYFQITNGTKTLFYAGNSDYYLQSVDYNGTITATTPSGATAGFGLNLTKGWIDAPNLKIYSKNLKLESDYILADATTTTGPYFRIKDSNGNILFNANSTRLYLQAGSIEGSTSHRRIYISSDGNPYLQIRAKNDKILMYFADENQYLQSSNYSSTAGTNINLTNGTITSAKFKLTAGNDTNGKVVITGGDSSVPYIQVSKGSGSNVKVYFNVANNGTTTLGSWTVADTGELTGSKKKLNKWSYNGNTGYYEPNGTDTNDSIISLNPTTGEIIGTTFKGNTFSGVAMYANYLTNTGTTAISKIINDKIQTTIASSNIYVKTSYSDSSGSASYYYKIVGQILKDILSGTMYLTPLSGSSAYDASTNTYAYTASFYLGSSSKTPYTNNKLEIYNTT